MWIGKDMQGKYQDLFEVQYGFEQMIADDVMT
jgi:hypothetical protein